VTGGTLMLTRAETSFPSLRYTAEAISFAQDATAPVTRAEVRRAWCEWNKAGIARASCWKRALKRRH
jgi:hypothetical protein